MPMDNDTLKKMALEAAMERVVGQSSVPVKYVAGILKQFKEMLSERNEQLQRQEQRDQEIMGAISELTRTIKKYDGILTAQNKEIERLSQVKQGNPGKDADPEVVASIVLEKMPKPKDGRTPEIETIVEAVVSRIPAPKSPKIPTIDEILKKVKKETEIKDWRKIPGLENEIASYRNQLAGKVYGKDTLVRGGGMTMSAGSNVTLVPLNDGTVQINASGGGSGTNVTTQYQLTAVAAGIDATIDLTQLTNYATFTDLIAVYQNNIMLTEGLNFTVAGDTVTVINGTDADIYNVTYAYA